MRSIHLFVIMVGIVPLLAFATTVWLSDGAPFEPFGRLKVAPLAAPASAPDAPISAENGGEALAERPRDPEIDRLQQLARGGDTEAALLLAILDGSR